MRMGNTRLNHAGLIEISVKIVGELWTKEIERDERQMPRNSRISKTQEATD